MDDQLPPATDADHYTCAPCPTLCLAGMNRYSWRSVSTVLYLDATSMRTGSLRQARCSLATCAAGPKP